MSAWGALWSSESPPWLISVEEQKQSSEPGIKALKGSKVQPESWHMLGERDTNGLQK